MNNYVLFLQMIDQKLDERIKEFRRQQYDIVRELQLWHAYPN